MELSTLKKLRYKNNLTQAEVADKIGMKRTAYTNKESGSRRFSLEEASAIAKLFGCSIEEVFFNK